MDVQGVLRWLVDAKIPVAKAMPLVSALAKAGVRDVDGIGSLSEDDLAAAVTDKPLLNKIRAKAAGKGGKRSGAGGASSPSANKKSKASSAKGADKAAGAAERAPDPPDCSLSDARLAEIEIKTNRSPVMVLWATEVAQRLSFDWSESVTIGRAMADWLALRKGEHLGLLEADEAAEGAARDETKDLETRTVEIMGQDFTLRRTIGGWRALSKGKLVPAKRVHTFLCKAFGDNLGPARAALRALAAAIPKPQVESGIRAMVLYESFRPEVPKGKAGWGQAGMLRLRKVLELKEELLREAAPVGGKAGKIKNLCVAKQNQKQHQQLRRPKPLWQRCLPLVVSGAVLHGLSFAFLAADRPRNDRAIFALLCFFGGVVAVEATQRAVAMFGGVLAGVDAAVFHFGANASGYMASFVTVVVLQGVWDEAQDNNEGAPDLYLSALSCLAVLALGILLHLVAPILGGFLLRQLDDVRLTRCFPGGDRRYARWGWKTAKECFATSVVFGLCITAAALSGGGALLLGLGMTHSVVSASREALPVIRKGWLRRKMSRSKSAMAASSSTQDCCSLQGVIMLVRSGPTRVVCSPVILPAFLLWMTRSTICSWPKECTDPLVFLLKVSATTVCTTHLMRPSLPGTGAPARGGNGDSGANSTALANKVFVFVCALAAWTLLLPCCLIVFGQRESSEGILAMFLVVTTVALRTRREKAWRGLMLLFWVALLSILMSVACSKLLQQNKVFRRVFSDDVGGSVIVPSYLGIFKAMSQLREEARVAMWTVCPPSAAEGAGRSWFGFWSL
eukprot:g6718.t1